MYICQIYGLDNRIYLVLYHTSIFYVHFSPLSLILETPTLGLQVFKYSMYPVHRPDRIYLVIFPEATGLVYGPGTIV